MLSGTIQSVIGVQRISREILEGSRSSLGILVGP